MNRIILKAAALAASLMAFAIPASAHADSFYGMNLGGALENGRTLDVAQSTGVPVGRFGAAVNVGDQISQLRARGVAAYPIVVHDYGSFAAQYGTQTNSIEIGNEPNLNTATADYAARFRTARAEILRADPTARVVVGGLAAQWFGDTVRFNAYSWTTDLIHDLGFCPAAIGWHAYPFTLSALEMGLVGFRNTLVGAGCSHTQVDVNEFYMVNRDPIVTGQALTWMHDQPWIAHVLGFFWDSPGFRGSEPLVYDDNNVTVFGHQFIAAWHGVRTPLPAAASYPQPKHAHHPTVRKHHRRHHRAHARGHGRAHFNLIGFLRRLRGASNVH